MTTQDRRWLAREVARGLTKTLSARNKEQERSEFAKLATSFVSLHGPLRLELDGRTVTAAGEKLHDEASSQLGLRLTIEGVRDITLEPGVTEAEVTDLLAALDKEDGPAPGGLLEADFAHVDVGTFVFTDRIERPAALAPAGDEKVQAMRARADQAAKDLESRGILGNGPLELEVSDGGGELFRLAKIALVEVRDPPPPDVAQEELIAFRGRALEASHPTRALLQLAEVVLEGLAVDPDAIGEANARWFIEAAPALALRHGNLGLLAALLDRYMAELTASGGLVAAALNSVIGGLSSRDGIEKLIAIGTSGTAEGGPEAFVAVLEALGTAGVQAALQAHGRTSSKELRDALNTFLTENVGAFPETLKPLVDRNATAETAKWALFLVSKSVKGPAAEPLLESGKHHPASAVSEYATFLWKTATPRGRLTAFLDSIDKNDVAERIRAVDALGKAKDAEALPVLVKLVDDPSFLSRPPEEMKAFLGAISEIGGPQMITFFEKQSERSSGIFKIRAGNEVREQAKTLLQQLIDKGGAR